MLGVSTPHCHPALRQRITLTITSQISKEDTLNPILQDTKKGKLRFVRNCFPHKGYLWNYGAFPQVRHTDARSPVRPMSAASMNGCGCAY